MKRVPEPELMDDTAQVRAYARADFVEPHTMFVRLFGEKFPSAQSCARVLDLGCGPCDVSVRFAKRFRDCMIDALDGAGNMLQYAGELVQQNNLSHRFRFIRACLPTRELPPETYDVVISNSLLHHLSEPLVLWHCVEQAARPGSAIFIMDLMRPRNRDVARAMVERYSPDEPDILKNDFFHSLCAAYSVSEVRQQLVATSLAGLTVETVSDRHLVIYGNKPGG